MTVSFRLGASVIVSLVFAGVGSQTSVASVLFQNPLVSPASGYASNDPASTSSQQMADDFWLSTASTIRSITWYGNYSDDEFELGSSTQFIVRLFADVGDGTSPVNGVAIFEEAVTPTAAATGVSTTADDRQVFKYASNILSAPLLSVGTYWLSIVESDPSTTIETWEWQATLAGSGATNVRRLPPTTVDWIGVGDAGRTDRAFELSDVESHIDAVPEPPSVLVFSVYALVAFSFYCSKQNGHVYSTI